MTKNPVYHAWDAERAADIIEQVHAETHPGSLMPIMHALQHEFGYVPDEAVPMMAKTVNLSRADVHGVLTFYHDFRHHPAGQRVVKLCRAEACQARGVRQVEKQLEEALGVKMGETRADNKVTLEAIYCLGLCASGPAALVDGEPVARLTGARIDALVREVLS